MELRIINCLECSVAGESGKMKDEKPNIVEITSREVCSKCGKEIRIRNIKVEMDKKSFGEVKYFLTWN